MIFLANLLKSDAWSCFFLFHCVRCQSNCYVIVAGNWFISRLIVGALASSVLTFRFVVTSVWTCEKDQRHVWEASDRQRFSFWRASICGKAHVRPNVARKIVGETHFLNKSGSRYLKNWRKDHTHFKLSEAGGVYILFTWHIISSWKNFSIMNDMWSDNRSKLLEQNVKPLITCRSRILTFSAVNFTRKQTERRLPEESLQKIVIGQMRSFTNALALFPFYIMDYFIFSWCLNYRNPKWLHTPRKIWTTFSDKACSEASWFSIAKIWYICPGTIWSRYAPVSDQMLFLIKQIFSTRADVPGVGLCSLTECLTETFWLTDRDTGTKPSNRDCPGLNGTYGIPTHTS